MVSRQNNEEKEMEEVKEHSETSITGSSIPEWVYNSVTMTAPMTSADLIKGIVVKFQDTDSSLWKKAKIYRNGIHTTVKWGDGTITRVKLTEGEEGNDVDAFLNALGKKLFGSRTALKKFVEQNTIVQKKKVKKVEEEKKPECHDSHYQPINVGDAVFLDGKTRDGRIEGEGKICKVSKVDGRYYICVDGFNCGEHGVFAGSVTKVRVEPPYSAGDYVVFRNAKENHLVHMSAWTRYMSANRPLMIEKVEGVNLLCSDGCVYESIWVRGIDEWF